MLFLIAGCNFAMAMLLPESGYAGLNVLVGGLVLAGAIHTGTVKALRDVRTLRGK